MTRPTFLRRDRKRVVIVDDSRTMQALLEQVLSGHPGFEIVGIAADGRSAVAMIRDLCPDLVTIDLNMPYVDGRGLLDELKAFPAMHKVVISSHACGSLAIRASLEALGADACMSKDAIAQDARGFCQMLRSIVARPKPATRGASAALVSIGKAAEANASDRPAVARRHPVPADEQLRLAALAALNLANDDVDHSLDLLTAHLGQTTSFPACTMTFIDRDTQWIKSAYGFARGATTRAAAFCNHTICGDGPFIVHDTKVDPRFSDMQPQGDGPMIRAYVGCPIVSRSGVRLGSICLLDTRPRHITAAELTNLRSIALIAAELIERRTGSLAIAA